MVTNMSSVMAERNAQHISDPLLSTVPWDQPVTWTHPVLGDGSLGPARAVLTQPIPPKFPSKLTTFTLFPELPLDLRVYIWRMAVNFERVVRIFEDIEYTDSDSEADDSDDEEDENVRSIQALDRELKARKYVTNRRQKQLEDHGFTSSRPKPQLPTDHQLNRAAQLLWETTRVGDFRSADPMPVLLHVCRESRELLQSYGYKLAFSTRTAPANTWFNFPSDVLQLSERYESEEASPALDGGMWNIGQFSREDLDRLRKLALSINSFDYVYGGTVPVALHKAVQLCYNLDELLIVELDCHDEEQKDTYWSTHDGGEKTVVDLAVEELWGHVPDWPGGSREHWGWNYSSNRGNGQEWGQSNLEGEYLNFDDIAKNVEDQLRDHESCFPDRKVWKTPKVRFVILTERRGIEQIKRSREAYGRHIDNMYWRHVAEGRKSYKPPLPLHFRDGAEALHDLIVSTEENFDTRDMRWYKQARQAIYSVTGWPSPFTMEWIEASEARLDME